MGGAGIFGDFERADRDFFREFGASIAVAQCSGAGRLHDCGALPGGGECLARYSEVPRRGIRNWLRHAYSKILAFLASLVPAPFLLILFRGTGGVGAYGFATLAGREAN